MTAFADKVFMLFGLIYFCEYNENNRKAMLPGYSSDDY